VVLRHRDLAGRRRAPHRLIQRGRRCAMEPAVHDDSRVNPPALPGRPHPSGRPRRRPRPRRSPCRPEGCARLGSSQQVARHRAGWCCYSDAAARCPQDPNSARACCFRPAERRYQDRQSTRRSNQSGP
jgi:hypothetical protein